MAAVRLKVIPSFYAKCLKNNFFSSAGKHEKYTEQGVLHWPPRCRNVLYTQWQFYHFLLGNVEELLQNWEPLYFTYQHVASLWALFKYRLNGNIVVTSDQVFDNVQKAVLFNEGNRGVDRMPSKAEKRLSMKKYGKNFLAALKGKINANQWLSVCKNKWTC